MRTLRTLRTLRTRPSPWCGRCVHRPGPPSSWQRRDLPGKSQCSCPSPWLHHLWSLNSLNMGRYIDDFWWLKGWSKRPENPFDNQREGYEVVYVASGIKLYSQSIKILGHNPCCTKRGRTTQAYTALGTSVGRTARLRLPTWVQTTIGAPRWFLSSMRELSRRNMQDMQSAKMR